MYFSPLTIAAVIFLLVFNALLSLLKHLVSRRASRWNVPLRAVRYEISLPEPAKTAVEKYFAARNAEVINLNSGADLCVRGEIDIGPDSVSVVCWVEHSGRVRIYMSEVYPGEAGFESFAVRLAHEIEQYLTDTAILTATNPESEPEPERVIARISGFFHPSV
ncbi:MAG: hypothetical protein WC451_03900 [Patescibacteria group bacterium]